MVTFDRDSLVEQVRALKKLPQIKEVVVLRKRFERELEKMTVTKVPPKASSEEVKKTANTKRSRRLARYWRYIRLIRDNFPDLSTQEIREQLRRRREGGGSDIPDAIWQNPSP